MALHAVRKGDLHGAPPLVLLHGFGGSAGTWLEIIERLPSGMAVIAYDLPGHAGSLQSEGKGHAGDMARAILADLMDAGIARCHVGGHSMGGAVAAMMAIKAPDKVASLTLLAPGGFAPEINHRALRRFGAATTAAELGIALEPMLGFNAHYPSDRLPALVDARQMPGATAALADILRHILVEGRVVDRGGVDREGGSFQGVLPLEALCRLDLPISLLWGSNDMILPVVQADVLAGRADIKILADVGHMLVEEAPDVVLEMLTAQVQQV